MGRLFTPWQPPFLSHRTIDLAHLLHATNLGTITVLAKAGIEQQRSRTSRLQSRSRRGSSSCMQPKQVNEAVQSIRFSPLPAIVTGAAAEDCPIIAVNRAFEELTGYHQAEIVGLNCRLLAGRMTDRDKSAVLGKAVIEGAPAFVELLNYRKDGSEFLNAVMIAPVLDEQGVPCCFVGSQMQIARPEATSGFEAKLALLTQRQREVLRLMAKGLRNRQIGQELGLTEKTIKMHKGALVRRLQLSTSIEAVRLAVQAGL
jgi:PAS domain S-box-containing protein